MKKNYRYFVFCFVINLHNIQDSKEKYYWVFLYYFIFLGFAVLNQNSISRMERTILLHVHEGCHIIYIKTYKIVSYGQNRRWNIFILRKAFIWVSKFLCGCRMVIPKRDENFVTNPVIIIVLRKLWHCTNIFLRNKGFLCCGLLSGSNLKMLAQVTLS